MKIGRNAYRKNDIIFAIVLYTVSVVAIYIYVISPLFSYSGLLLDINKNKLVIAIVLYCISLKVLPHHVAKPSNYLFFLLYLILYIPTLSFYWLKNESTFYICILSISIILIEILIGLEIKGIKSGIRNANILLYVIFFVYIISVVLLVWHNGGVNIYAFRLDLISSKRETNNIVGIMGYLLNWCAKSFFPIFFAYFIYKRWWIFAAIIGILQLLLYLSFGFKAFLFSIVLILIMFIVSNSEQSYFSRLPMILALGVGVSFLLYMFNISKIPLLALPYRALYIPAAGQFEYYHFFTQNDYLFFSEGILGRILGIKYPYEWPIGVIVNKSIHGPDYYSNGNTGMFSYGYADLGVLGMLLASFMLVLIFFVVDEFTKKIPMFIVVASMSYQMIILNDTNILISMNTGGIIWSIFLLAIFNSSIGRYKERTFRRKE